MALVIVLFVGMAVFDAWFTATRIPQLGIEAEYNLLIRWLSKRYGIKVGVWVGVLIPTFCVIGVGAWGFNFLLYLLGCRTTLFAFQLKQFLGKNDSRTNQVLKRSYGPSKGASVLRNP